MIPEQILTRPGHIFNLWPRSRGLQPRCVVQRRRERLRFTGRECLCPGPVKHLSSFHCPVSGCYETALGAGAVGQTGSRAAPSRFYGAPTALCRAVALPPFVQRNNVSLPRFPGGHRAPSRRNTCVRLRHFCPRARRFKRESFEGFHSVVYLRVQRRLKTQRSVT